MKNDSEKETLSERRGMMGAVLLGTGGVLATPLITSAAVAETKSGAGFSKKALRPEGAPSADVGYSPAIQATGGQMLFISGQGPKDYDADMETQVRQTFDRIGLLLEAAGASFANVVILRSYWVHMLRDISVYRKVRKDYLVEPYPASTAVGTPELAIPGLELEIEAVAII